ncbi:hypothetical protein DFH08DRAFT_808071 [Mycena albidolilacea]|uniref:Uncharacterized protein n=1 Tax=Mycena albidolilacea TaxID=1033008 RepID=A0AAD7A2N5_9AGAR|nr:hypothetical protein DFH08DRAFT_808071 [Mycena albidolilacea]
MSERTEAKTACKRGAHLRGDEMGTSELKLASRVSIDLVWKADGKSLQVPKGLENQKCQLNHPKVSIFRRLKLVMLQVVIFYTAKAHSVMKAIGHHLIASPVSGCFAITPTYPDDAAFKSKFYCQMELKTMFFASENRQTSATGPFLEIYCNPSMKNETTLNTRCQRRTKNNRRQSSVFNGRHFDGPKPSRQQMFLGPDGTGRLHVTGILIRRTSAMGTAHSPSTDQSSDEKPALEGCRRPEPRVTQPKIYEIFSEAPPLTAARSGPRAAGGGGY